MAYNCICDGRRPGIPWAQIILPKDVEWELEIFALLMMFVQNNSTLGCWIKDSYIRNQDIANITVNQSYDSAKWKTSLLQNQRNVLQNALSVTKITPSFKSVQILHLEITLEGRATMMMRLLVIGLKKQQNFLFCSVSDRVSSTLSRSCNSEGVTLMPDVY